MKKITLLILLFAVSFGYSQTFTYDFEGTLHGFVGDGGPGVTNGPGNDVLEITAGVSDWDNVQVTFPTPLDLSNAAENTLRFTIQSTTAAPGEVHQHGVSFQGGGGSYEANFQTVGTDVTNVELNFDAGLGSREKLVIFIDVNDLGPGSIVATPNVNGSPSGALSGTYIIDNLSLGFDPGTCSDNVLNNGEEQIDCGGPNCSPCATDMNPPTGFTAVAGTVGGTTVELLLNAMDDSGADITYDITYDGGGIAQTTGASGTETSLVIENLTPETAYTFMISASDASGNPAANNAISVMATTETLIALPFDFDNTLHGFIGDGGPGVTNGAGNDVLEVTAGVSDWDNVQVTFSDPIDLSDAANNTLRFTIQSTTAMPGEVHQHGVSFQGGGGAYEANFQTVGTDVLNVELNFDAGLGSREKLVIFTDVGDLGGVAATPNVNGASTAGLSGTYIIDNITLGADPVDSTPPTGFTATAGTSTPFSVELLLNATEDSAGLITYDITYNGGANMVQTTGDSGVETSFSVTGLTESTDYTFEVSASDAAGNPAANNAISVMATTLEDTSTPCAGFSSAASEGSFSVGYNYNFVTEANGTDVTITFEVLDTDKVGLVGQVFIMPSTFIDMTNNGSNSFSTTLTGQTNGSDITFSGRFPYAGGLVRTIEYTYTVGDDCSGLANDDCANAEVIDSADFGTTISGTNVGATDSGLTDGCVTGNDVWYSFTAVQDGEVNVTVDSGFQYAFYSDCMGTLIGSCNASLTTATTGNTYYLRIGDDGTTTRIAPGGFNLSISGSALSTDSFDLLSSLKIYPNPTNDSWNIEGANITIDTIEVYDILGKRVSTLKPNGSEATIDASNLRTGLYLAKLYSGDAVTTIKLVKN